MKNLILEMTRGIAAIFVVLNHIINSLSYFKIHNNLFFNTIGQWGTEAVIIFFVLSGVVIAMSQEKKKKSPMVFLFGRIIRIVPIYLFSIIITLISHYIIGGALPSIKVIFGNLFFVDTLQGYIVPTFPLNLSLWTLSFEMAFYVLYSFVLKKKQLIYFWMVIATVSSVINYIDLDIYGIVKHVVIIFSYSSIWLLGYYVYMYRHKFFISRKIAFLSLSLLPIAAKINIGSGYYNLVNHFIFALASVPFFIYSLNQGLEKEDHKGKVNIHLVWIGIMYLLFSVLIWKVSNTHNLNKYIYISLPLIVYVLVNLPIKLGDNRIGNAVMKRIRTIMVFSGSISYALYCVHFPILRLTEFYIIDSIILILICFIFIVLIISVMLELILQPIINRKIRIRY